MLLTYSVNIKLVLLKLCLSHRTCLMHIYFLVFHLAVVFVLHCGQCNQTILHICQCTAVQVYKCSAAHKTDRSTPLRAWILFSNSMFVFVVGRRFLSFLRYSALKWCASFMQNIARKTFRDVPHSLIVLP